MSSESDGKVTGTGEGAPPVISTDSGVGEESDPGDKDTPPTMGEDPITNQNNQQSVSGWMIYDT